LDATDFSALAARIPRGVRFGTSSWTYPGWCGLVYSGPYPRTRPSAPLLGEYARFPLFGTVGIDSSYYRPLEPETLAEYAAELPPGFPCVSKVWDRITVHTFSRHDKVHPGERNPDFLNAPLFEDEVLGPMREHFTGHTGPFLFELQSVPRNAGLPPGAFADALDRFLGALPRDAQYAVELRNAEYLSAPYFAVLREHDVAHAFNSWTRMPSIGEQLDLEGSITAPFLVARALMVPGLTYEDSVDAFAPFDRIQAPRPDVRADLLRLIRAALGRGLGIYVLVNNRLEGNSPLTIAALAEMLVAESDAQ
jgi:uncharacterized protein YecE (DUF72 family)